ncbi:MAG: hypothetical protein ACRDYY_17245 [Acidimicrobiales bacterium]
MPSSVGAAGMPVLASQQSAAQFLTEWLQTIEPTVRPSTFDSYRRNVNLHVIPRIGAVRLTKVDAGVLNGLYAQLPTSGRLPSSRAGQGYSQAVVDRARTLRQQGATLTAAAKTLREELPEAAHITKDTLASLLRRSGSRPDGDGLQGLDRRSVNYIHTILHRAFKDAVRWGRLARNPASVASSGSTIVATTTVEIR